MLYKERVIRDQPVDVSYLNAWVSLSQFVSGLLVAPLIFDAEVRLMLAILSSGSPQVVVRGSYDTLLCDDA